MMDKFVSHRGAYYEGDLQDLRSIFPTPVVSPISAPFATANGGESAIFREDDFDPVTRIRRGRVYVGGRRNVEWFSGRVDHGPYRPPVPYRGGAPVPTWTPDEVFDAWIPSGGSRRAVYGRLVEIGGGEYTTCWRVVGVEKTAMGHTLLTLRASSLLGVLPELAPGITDQAGNMVDAAPIQSTLDALVDVFHRQQATPTVDAARESARVLLAAWIGPDAFGLDLKKVIPKIPDIAHMTQWAASIINRLHPRGKSAEVENRASKGSALRSLEDSDGEVSVELVGLLMREIGWAAR